ncbi:ribonuclease H family protein [Metapseudomonas boanensis]|uniref:Uncharacterized protein n=1 Tax=Metapseudomonas boanensis TaxID=2822138 RepID=A0ABS5XAZ0_9GAMM|nr:hypothetical protein [Pseudomonas boanensis]MBT8764797.1 hypothetical protein [Pseudomonas boanensis]
MSNTLPGFSTHLAKWILRGWRRKDKKRVEHRDLWEHIVREGDRHQLKIVWTEQREKIRQAAELAAISRDGERFYRRHRASPDVASQADATLDHGRRDMEVFGAPLTKGRAFPQEDTPKA